MDSTFHPARSLGGACARTATLIGRLMLALLSGTLFAVLAMLAPLISGVLMFVCLAGLATCVLFGILEHSAHFSMPLVLGISLVSALLWASFHAFMDWLSEPDTRSRAPAD